MKAVLFWNVLGNTSSSVGILLRTHQAKKHLGHRRSAERPHSLIWVSRLYTRPPWIQQHFLNGFKDRSHGMWFWLKQKYESVNRGSVISTRTHPLTQSASNTARLFMSSLTPIPNVLGQAWSRRLGIRSQGLHPGLCLTHWLCFQSPHSPSFGRKSNIIPPCSSPLGCERAK